MGITALKENVLDQKVQLLKLDAPKKQKLPKMDQSIIKRRMKPGALTES